MEDVVTLGGFTVQNQGFTIAQRITSGLIDGNVSGIMGLAFQQIASSGATPPWLAIINQLSSPEFGVFLARFDDDESQVNPTTGEIADQSNGGALTLGGTDGSLFTGNVEFQPLSGPQSFWFQTVTGAVVFYSSCNNFAHNDTYTGITIRGNQISIPTSSGSQAAIDTGTTLIGAPSAVVQSIYQQIPGSQALNGNMQGFYQFRKFTEN